ncbi:MAG: alanine--glyoxylate aminotransferase family protein [Clostridiaceae bacterium]
MDRRAYLQVPGPTNVPDRILRTLSMPLINHRGPEFEELLVYCIDGLKRVFRTTNDVLIFPSSGSGGLESAIVNLLSPGDTIAVVSLGVFSERMGKIAESYGVNVIRIEKEWGEAVKAEDVAKVLNEDTDKKIKLVCLPQNETATGISNDIEAVGKTMKESGHPALLVVDAVSSLACLPFEMDAWGVDVAVSASQKGFMLPPGMSMVALNEKAWKLNETAKLPKWYWDYKAVKAKLEEKQMPYTPPTTLLFGLKEAINMLEEEGLENVWARHKMLGDSTRNALKAMGLKIFAENGYESDTITAVYLPEGIKYKEIAELLRTKYGLVIGGGLQKIQGKIMRIGHLGSLHELEIYAILGAIEMGLYELGYKVELGTAARAVANTILEIKE